MKRQALRLLISVLVPRDPLPPQPPVPHLRGGEGYGGAASPAPHPGARYALRFELLAPMAVGSTARVDLCRSLGPLHSGMEAATPRALPGQLLAVKRPLAELAGDESVGRRFLDEVWMTASLHHANVAGVAGWGHDQAGPYLAVELVQGVSLARLMKSVFETGEQFSERLVVYIGLCVARGLAAAHELTTDRGELLHLVHRDLSAANVLVGFGGEVKISDFGLAKARDRLTVTTSELPTRSLAHVSPEELAQDQADHRSDLFAYGVMLFELLTGRPPFKGKDEIATLEAVMRHPPPDPVALRAKMDRALAALVLRCLEKSPARRPQSAREIVAELERWLDVHGYRTENVEALARFVRRNSMRQMRWFERVISGEREPSPSPFAPPKISLYDPAADGPTGGVAASTSTKSTRTQQRADEPTLVDRPKPKPSAPRRSRSTDSFQALQKTRRLSEEADPLSGVPSFVDHESEDDVPTVALRIDASTRDALASGKQVPRHGPSGRGPLGTAYLDGSRTPEPPRGGVIRTIERELERLRELATERHDRARSAREAARVAVLEAERAEADARLVERAIGGARQALDTASRGNG